ncbi:hypothetical protein Gpo141_00001916 [Globisporangium polare]
MADKFSGRVYAGEDSEDDEEEEEIQYSFQFGGYGASQSSTGTTPALSLPVAPRFNVQAPLVAPAIGGGEESDDDEESGGDEGAVSLAKTSATESVTVATPAAANGEESEEDGGDSEHERAIGAGLDISTVQSEERKNVQSAPPSSSNASLPSPSLKNVVAFTTAAPLHKQKLEDDDAHWSLDGSPEDGIQLMGDSIVSRLQPSLDDSIHRIAELTESQEHLLHLLSTQNASICANEQVKNVAVVMDKLPHYIRKIQDIRAAMTEISASVEKMKKRAENLRVDAQSHAIKKENKRDSMSQWNKLYAAKNAELAANGSSSAE